MGEPLSSYGGPGVRYLVSCRTGYRIAGIPAHHPPAFSFPPRFLSFSQDDLFVGAPESVTVRA